MEDGMDPQKCENTLKTLWKQWNLIKRMPDRAIKNDVRVFSVTENLHSGQVFPKRVFSGSQEHNLSFLHNSAYGSSRLTKIM